ncbi:hypothetical protein AXE80_00410 [Wenyingzhuangia fucanilytica]|uniref:SPOR domain-containing protein n=1 Tax=Wenyingzhuangia fucanilytica TaxID=1790137 RepID=A0A1B1Y277_9FLAO|nr:SPOR domain-containing protein [Wenyingzhuangia fucanilytica]ANW94848.1 hypothetical protein AXE80_00410 [Wenyingzhuangia fucanilytica]
MSLKRSKNLLNIGKVICALFVLISVACSTKKEEAPVVKKEVVAPVKKEVVKPEVVKPVNVITYGVQIGAYRKFDVQFDSDIKNIKHNGLSNYVLGNFKTIKEAENLLKIVTDLKIMDAFIVKMKDGEIIE